MRPATLSGNVRGNGARRIGIGVLQVAAPPLRTIIEQDPKRFPLTWP